MSACDDHMALRAFVDAKSRLHQVPTDSPLWASTMGHLGVAACVVMLCVAPYVAATSGLMQDPMPRTQCVPCRYYCNRFEIAARCFALALEGRMEVSLAPGDSAQVRCSAHKCPCLASRRAGRRVQTRLQRSTI